MNEIYRYVADIAERGQEAVLVTVVEKAGSAPAVPGTKMLVSPDGSSRGTVGGGELEQRAKTHGLELLALRESGLVKYSLLEGGKVAGAEPLAMLCGGNITLFFEYLGYQAHVYVFGAGHVGAAIARCLADTGCRVTLIDDRDEVVAALQDVESQLTPSYGSPLQNEPVPDGSFFVIATTSHDADLAVLRQVFTSGWHPGYVGLLASKRKAEELVRRLEEELGTAIDRDVLFSPVGLDIGGRSPAEIAIAIAAEIQAVRYGKRGHQHMRIKARRPT